MPWNCKADESAHLRIYSIDGPCFMIYSQARLFDVATLWNYYEVGMETLKGANHAENL